MALFALSRALMQAGCLRSRRNRTTVNYEAVMIVARKPVNSEKSLE
jgi:hypothetical protein